MEDIFSIGEISTLSLSKEELIEIINRTFPDNEGKICVITETSTYKTDYKNQTITFGKVLKMR